jgi:hypothetical protein
MGSVPTSPRAAVLAWCEAHVDVFRFNAANIGLSADQALHFGTLTEGYASAAAAAEKARQEADALSDQASDAYRLMRRAMSNAITDIRQFAQDQPNPQTVYTLAQVPPRQDPQTAPPPGQPTNLSVSLVSTTGALELRWRSNNPSGTSYIVRRRLPTQNEFAFIGVTGERRFVDNTFIAGPDSVEYIVQGQRADSASPLSEVFVIRFGRNGPGRTLSIEGVNEGTNNAAAHIIAARRAA